MAKAGGGRTLSTAYRSGAFLEISDFFSNIVKYITYKSFMYMYLYVLTFIKVICDEIGQSMYSGSYVMWALK
jgi:hypothetical protein